MNRPTKDRVRDVIEEVNELDLPEGAHWMMIHERLGLNYGDVFDYIAADPEFYATSAGRHR
jgi:hypothetical protein